MMPAEVIARHIVARGYEDLPAVVIETTKRLILDALATTLTWRRQMPPRPNA